MSATIISPCETELINCPRLSDVEAAMSILRYLGCKTERDGDMLIIYGLYRITAARDLRDGFFPGAISATLVLVLFSALFSWFISISTRYPLIYGSLASIIIFMLWLYFCGQVLIMCTVFAESEVVSLVAQNRALPDIIHGLNSSVADKVSALVNRIEPEGEFIITGGVAKNMGVVRALEKSLGAKLYVCGEAQICGALGAALFALE